MAKLIYSMIASLDGYVADEKGKFDWAMPSEEVHAFVNDLESRVGTYLYGRKLYEVMVAWETQPVDGDEPKVMLPDKVRVALELLAERRFENGVVHLHYRVKI